MFIITNYDKIKPTLKPILSILAGFINSHAKAYPFLKNIKLDENLLSSILIVLILIIFFFINYVFKLNTIVLPHQDAIKKDFPELEFNKKLIAISQSLENELNRIDKETNWSDYYFIPIEAEVEIYHNNKKERKITDLMQALKRNKSTKVFLLIGDPGSGKSVALRKLCRDIIKETRKTGRIPVYINLKEWEPSRVWTEMEPPLFSDLQEFVLKDLKSKLDIFGSRFFDEYYYKLHEQGRVYYIIDSFDEIPSLLDVTESSWLIKKLSHIVYQFITSGYESRGLLASRLFRRPSKNFDAHVTLEIRSMSDYKIKENLIRSGAFNNITVQKLYNERIDLIHLASNPFIAALLSNYVKTNNGSLPKSRTDLFSNYIVTRLCEAEDKIKENGLSKEVIISYGTKVASLIFSKQLYGLEIPLEVLKEEFKQFPFKIETVIDILIYSKIGRMGIGEKKMFSFVHRRFNEYFVVQSLLEEEKLVDLFSIPSDSRYRDALVLYCEVAPEKAAIDVVNFCWGFIKNTVQEKIQLTNPRHLEAVFCLRFLRDAFILRSKCIEHIKEELSGFIFKQMYSENFLVKKIALESAGLLNKIELEKTILIALNNSNSAIKETAFKEGKFLTEVNKGVEKTLIRYLLNIPFWDFYFKKKEIQFSLSLSSAFKKVHNAYQIMAFDQYIIVLGLALMSINQDPRFPLLSLLFICMSFINVDSLGASIIPTHGNSLKETQLNSMQDLTLKTSKLPDVFEPIDGKNYKFMISRKMILALYLRSFLISLLAIDLLHMLSKSNNHLSMFHILYSSVVLILLFPFIKLYLFIKSTEISKVSLIKLCKMLIVIGISSVLIIYLLAIINQPLFAVIFILVMSVAIVFLFIYAIFYYFKSYFNDQKIMKSISIFEEMDRESIAQIFNEIRFSYYRTRFVKNLEMNVTKVSGHWPSDIIPNVRNDYASLKLFQLDALWLGLDV